MRKVVFLFGRFQVPTKGHAEMIKFGAQYAQRNGAEFRLYTSKSYDPVKNPLPYGQKIEFLRKLFPGINIVDDPNVKTAFDICRQLSDAGVDDVTMVVGGDRVAEFQRNIGRYVMPRNTPGFDPKKNYGFKNFNVINSGARKAGVSGTQMREYIRKGKFSEFLKTAPTTNRALAKQIFTTAKTHLKEELSNVKPGMSRKEFDKALHSFIDFTCKELGIKKRPSIEYKDDKGHGQPSFGGYAPHSKVLMVYTKNRHPMDIFRTVAHELVHHKQNEDGRLGKDVAKEGATGSDIENEANADAGKVMRFFGKENPFYFDMTYVTENKAIVLAGTPGSGKDKILKESILPLGFTEVSAENFHATKFEGNVVVNGTSNFEKIATIKEALDLRGYESIMVFVNTSNEVSKQRNEARTGKGRVIAESVRFNKWLIAQEDLNKYDALFEKVIEIKNDLDLNQTEQVIQETYEKLISMVTKELEEFTTADIDRRFTKMLEEYSDFGPGPKNNPVGGAGNWGTDKLRDRYANDTPGQTPGPHNEMKVLDLKPKETVVTRKTTPSLPIGGDRIGDEIGMPKSPGFGDNSTIDIVGLDRQIDRWMVKEETRKRFKAKYGALAEQKIKEAAAKIAREGMEDPSGGYSAMVSSTGGPPEQVDNFSRIIYNKELEKKSIFGKIKKYKKTK